MQQVINERTLTELNLTLSFVCDFERKKKKKYRKPFSRCRWVLMGVLCSGFSCCDGLISVYVRPAGSHKGSARVCLCRTDSAPQGGFRDDCTPSTTSRSRASPTCSVPAGAFPRRPESRAENSPRRRARSVGGRRAVRIRGASRTCSSRAKKPGPSLAPSTGSTSPRGRAVFQEDALARGLSHSR